VVRIPAIFIKLLVFICLLLRVEATLAVKFENTVQSTVAHDSFF